jgi:hypothetical protein
MFVKFETKYFLITFDDISIFSTIARLQRLFYVSP